jgi:hypothetical protein
MRTALNGPMLRLCMSGKNGFWGYHGVGCDWLASPNVQQASRAAHARRPRSAVRGALYHGVRLHQNPQVIVDSQPGSTRKSRVHSRYAAGHDRRGNLERYLAKPLGTHLDGKVIHKQDIATLVDK